MRPTRPAGQAFPSAGTASGPAQDEDLDLALWHARKETKRLPILASGRDVRRQVLATRKPTLLLRFAGLLLLR